MGSSFTKLRDSIQDRGLWGTFRHIIYVKLPYLYRKYRATSFDRKYGIETTIKIAVEKTNIESDNIDYAVHYEAVAFNKFNNMMTQLDIDHKEYIFIDLGSGKGRALILATRFPFKKIVGVEFSRDIHEIAEKNIAVFRNKTGLGFNIELHCLDATKYPLPQDNLVLFLYNPIHGKVLDKVIEKIRNYIKEDRNNIYILYLNPVEADVFQREDSMNVIIKKQEYIIYKGNRVSVVS